MIHVKMDFSEIQWIERQSERQTRDPLAIRRFQNNVYFISVQSPVPTAAARANQPQGHHHRTRPLNWQTPH